MPDASPIAIEKLADEMFALVEECAGKRKLKAGDDQGHDRKARRDSV